MQTFKSHYLNALLILSILFLIPVYSVASINLESDEFSVEINSKSPTPISSLFDDLQVSIYKHEQNKELIHIEIDFTNTSNSIINLSPIHLTTGNEIQIFTNDGGGLGALFYEYTSPLIVKGSSGDAKKIDTDFFAEGSKFHANNWYGWTNRYFIEAIRLTNSEDVWRYTIKPKSTEKLNPENLYIQIEYRERTINAGEKITLKFDYILTPKIRTVLSKDSIGLEKILLIGLWDWFRTLCFIIWNVLDHLFSFTGNWGISIILLALIIRLLTIPITRISLRYQEKSINQQLKFTPLVREIKQNYSGVEQSEKIIELYKNYNYDHLAPFKSMLGLFIQIPIFIALFQVIGNAWELNGQSFLWIKDLAISDRFIDWKFNIPYFGRYLNVLPILMAVITIQSTRLTAKNTGNKNTSALTLFGMAAIFFILFYSFPAALVLYWASSNAIQLLQQLIENSVRHK